MSRNIIYYLDSVDLEIPNLCCVGFSLTYPIKLNMAKIEILALYLYSVLIYFRLVDRFSRQSSLFLGNCTGPAGHRNGVNPLFSFPWSAVKYIREDDKLLLTEWGNRAVRIIHIKTKRVETLIKSDRLIRMKGLAQDKSTGDLFIVYSHGVMKYSMSDKSLTALTGSTQAGFADGSLQDARFNHPNAILILSPGKFLLTDFDNQLLRRLDLDANTADSICSGRRDGVDGNLTSCQLSHPNSLLRVDDTIYIGQALV